MTIPKRVSIGGVWKEVSEMKICIGETWKVVDDVKVSIGGVWKDININPWGEIRPDGINEDKQWWDSFCSQSGSNLVVLHRASFPNPRIHKSSNYGYSWSVMTIPLIGGTTPDLLDRFACDETISKVIACNNRLWLSSDYGETWNEKQLIGDVNGNWAGVSSNYDGSVLTACEMSNGLYVSFNSGVNWTNFKPGGGVQFTKCSPDSDGSTLLLVGPDGPYVSTNFGSSWSWIPFGGYNWCDVDDDGSFLVIAGDTRIYYSSNGGVDWGQLYPAGDVDRIWYAVGCNSDATYLFAAAYNGRLYTSINSGVDWSEQQPVGAVDKQWTTMSANSDHSIMLAGYYSSGRLYQYALNS